ncbi:MAG: hypothetical protein ACK5AY_01255, partial [Bacteroidota bacterium]
SPPVFSIPRASPVAIEPLLPGVTWQPLDLIEGEKVGKNQLKETLNINELDRGVYFILFVGKNGINKKRFVAIR